MEQNDEINRYREGKIYKLIDETNGNIYIGSTTKTIEQRLLKHKNSYKCYLNGKQGYTTSFIILENKNYKIELIELFACNNKRELINREGWYIRNLNCINKRLENRTEEEKKNYITQYIIDNKDKLNNNNNIRNKQKYICNCGKKLNKGNKTNHKRTKKHINYINQLNNNPQE